MNFLHSRSAFARSFDVIGPHAQLQALEANGDDLDLDNEEPLLPHTLDSLSQPNPPFEYLDLYPTLHSEQQLSDM